MEEQPRDEQPKPDDKTKQAHHIDDGQSADAFLHELAEVRHHADGEEGEQEEDDAERVQRTGNARAGLLQLGGLEADDEENGKRDDIAEHKAGETGPHVAPVHGPVAGLVKLGAPYPCEDQGPHADEYVDEDLDGGGDHDDPAGINWEPGCGTGEGAMLALNSFPGVICGHVEDPVDAYTFAHVNDGNAVAMPFAKGFGWGGELNLEYCFEKLFGFGHGQGYPKERVVPEQRNKKILDGVRAATFKPLIECLKSIDQDLLKGAVAGAKFSELFFASCKDEELAAYVKTLL